MLRGDKLEVTARLADQVADFVDAALDHRRKAEILANEPLRERRARALARAICLRQAFMAAPAQIRREWRIPLVRTEADLREWGFNFCNHWPTTC